MSGWIPTGNSTVPENVSIVDGPNKLNVNPDGSINVNDNTETATNPTVVNLLVILANTEYSYIIPVNSKIFSIKDRAGDAKMAIAYIAGGTSTQFETVNPGCTHIVKGVLTVPNFRIYFQSTKPNRVIEISSWA